MKRTLLFLVLLAASAQARAIELKLSAPAIQRTLQQQLFNGPDGRYYLRGNATSACYIYVDDPTVRFVDDRVVVHVKTHSRLGAGVMGRCVGVTYNTESEVSVVPDAESETVGFRDARIDHITGNRELDFLLSPFLSRRLPDKMKINAAEILRTALVRSHENTGYDLRLHALKIHSMLVRNDHLEVDLDGTLDID